MTLRSAMGAIVALPYFGNNAGSFRTAKGFENEVTNILRNVGHIEERPSGANGYPAFTCNGVNYQIKTAKGNKPMWNESYVRPDSVLILNLGFGTVVVHGSLITDYNMEAKLIEAKDFVAKSLRERFPEIGGENFFVSGGRIQFGDNIDWESSKISFLNKTINILEEVK